MELRTEGRLVNSKLYYLDGRKGGSGESEWTTRWVGETLTTTTRNRLTGAVIAVSTLSLHANGQLVYVIENRSSSTSRRMTFRRLSGEEAK